MGCLSHPSRRSSIAAVVGRSGVCFGVMAMMGALGQLSPSEKDTLAMALLDQELVAVADNNSPQTSISVLQVSHYGTP
jgi:membrane associated rhomboid family serine protease